MEPLLYLKGFPMAVSTAKALIAQRIADVSTARADGVAISYGTFQEWLAEIDSEL